MHALESINTFIPKPKTVATWAFGSLLSMVIFFFIGSAILMATWNYTIPKLAHSVEKKYDEEKDFTPIDYPTAMVFMFLLYFLFK